MTRDQLPYPRYEGLKHAKAFTLPDRLFLSEGYRSHIVEKGVTVKLLTSKNFGYVILPPEAKAPWDQRIFAY